MAKGRAGDGRRKPAKKSVPPHGKKPPGAEELDWDESNEPAPYADFVRSTANERQFLLHFGQIDPDKLTVTRAFRVALHPKTAGDLLALLVGQIGRYEKSFGVKITPEGFSLHVDKEEEKDD